MIVYYRKGFIKELERVPHNVRKAFAVAVAGITQASQLGEVGNLKKLRGYSNVYRLKLSDHRAVFLTVERGQAVEFLYIASRGEVYSKKYKAIIDGL